MESTKQLAELIDRKHQILVQLRDVGRRQMELVASRDTASLIKLLAVKQNLITALQASERSLAPHMKANPEQRAWPSDAERTRCATQANECNEILREIVSMEKAGIDQMTAHRNQIAQQLHEVHAAVDVRNAYQAQR